MTERILYDVQKENTLRKSYFLYIQLWVCLKGKKIGKEKLIYVSRVKKANKKKFQNSKSAIEIQKLNLGFKRLTY
jgi:IS5 family transposase